MNKITIAAILTSSLVLTACGSKAPPELPSAPAQPQVQRPVAPIDTGPGYTQGSQEDFLANVRTDRVFFDTDRFNIDAEDQLALQSQAQWLATRSNARITIEGHADERGTRDYNLALGERRANAAKNYLASIGVDPSRMSTVSYGKERPQALGSNPEAWAQNRRAVTIVIR